MRKYFIIIFFFIWHFTALSQDAPYTFAGNTISRDTTVTVPVTVSGFYNISGNGIVLKFDSLIAQVISVTKGPEIPGGLDYNISEPGKIIIGWYCWPPLSLPDSAVLYNITFKRVNTGITGLVFEDLSNGCYYSDSSFIMMNDIPAEKFYTSGTLNFVSAGSSIEKIPGITIFPNPCHESFIITIGEKLNGGVEVSLLTPSGRMIIGPRLSYSGNNLTVNTEELKCGLYILHLKYNGIISTYKIIISE